MTRRHAKDYITPRGYQVLVDELEHLERTERPRVVQEVSDAAAQGDRSENASYIYGKKRLREIDRRVRFLRKRLEACEVVDPRIQRGEQIFFGATVDVEDDLGREVSYQLVGPDEIDAESRRISYKSPIGRALLGRKLDDEVSVSTPKGERRLIVIDVRYE